MNAVVQDVKSIAASGTDTVTVQVPATGKIPPSLEIGVAVRYTAVAGTSGISAAFSVSKDNGSTWQAAVETALVVAPAANTLGYGSKKVYINMPLKVDGIPVTAVKVVCTNLDGTNAAAVAILSDNPTLF